MPIKKIHTKLTGVDESMLDKLYFSYLGHLNSPFFFKFNTLPRIEDFYNVLRILTLV